MRTALENDRDHELPEHHDPVKLLFDCTFHLGACVCVPVRLLELQVVGLLQTCVKLKRLCAVCRAFVAGG